MADEPNYFWQAIEAEGRDSDYDRSNYLVDNDPLQLRDEHRAMVHFLLAIYDEDCGLSAWTDNPPEIQRLVDAVKTESERRANSD